MASMEMEIRKSENLNLLSIKTLKTKPTKNGQTHSNNSLAAAVGFLRGWGLKD